MTVKEWLNKGRELNNEVEVLKESCKNALNLACNISASTYGEKVQTSKLNSSERKFIAYAEYAQLIKDRTAELVNYRAEMFRLINMVDNCTYRTLLIQRYINCQTWEQTAEAINRSVYWTRTRYHSNAIQSIKKLRGD